MYGRRGFEFTHVSAFANGDATDEFWADSFRRFGGHVTLSADSKIAFKPHQAIAFLDNGFTSFFLSAPWSGMAGHMKAAHLIFWWPAIEAKIREGSAAGALWRVPCNVRRIGRVYDDLRLMTCDLEPLRIPRDVIERARKEREAAGALQANSTSSGSRRELSSVRDQAQTPHSTSPKGRRRSKDGRQGRLKIC